MNVHSATRCKSGLPNARNRVIQALSALAFTLAPHLQIINYHGRFSSFVGI